MTNFLELALACTVRGWHVFPCWPASKKPMTGHGWKDASKDPKRVREWWNKTPDANVAIATAPSGLCVLDCDHGMSSAEDLAAFRAAKGLPETYTVRTGRRDSFGVQMYFTGDDVRSVGWVDSLNARFSGDIRCSTGYVMSAGSVHPSGAHYEAIADVPLAPIPAYVRTLKPERRAGVRDDGGPITSNRNNALTSIAGRLRNATMNADELEVALLQINERRCQPPLPEAEVRGIAMHAAAWRLPEAAPVVVIGSKGASISPEASECAEPVDWRTLFHTRAETENTPDPEFLLNGFLQAESVTGLIGPARARKSIVIMNVIHALLTGEPLFGRFEVSNKPERVVYLCPESGKKSLARRIRNMGLVPYVGKSLFYTSMNSDPVALADAPLREAVRGSVLVIDTAIRFFNGDENSSQDMKVFGEQCHTLIREGVLAILLLHHTAKSAETITLESGRGSGDFGGFLTCCWGTTLDDFEDAYNSRSLMTCVKQRDFQADSFRLAPSGDEDDFFLQYVEGSENSRVRVGAKEKPGKAKALAFVRAHSSMSGEAIQKALAAQGIDYSVSNCRTMLREVRALQVSEAP